MPRRRRSRTQKKHLVIEPLSEHTHTVIALHGMGDRAEYWRRIPQMVKEFALEAASGIRFVFLNAPRRYLAAYSDHYYAWFSYLTERSGQYLHDDCDMDTVEEMRHSLEQTVLEETNLLQGDAKRVVIMGSSQGGCMALDLAMVSRYALGGCVILRSLPMDWTPVPQKPSPSRRVPIVAISGDQDEVYPLGFVRECLARFSKVCDVRHVVVPDLSHMPECEHEERIATAFLLNMLGLGEFDPEIYLQAPAERLLPHERAMEGVTGYSSASPIIL